MDALGAEMTKLSRMILMAVLVCTLGFISLGCGGQEEASESEPLAEVTPKVERPKYKVPPTMEGMPAKATDVARTIQEELKVKQELPDYYPEDAPVYPGSLPSSIRTAGSMVTLGFGTKDSVAQVIDFMESDLNSNGWDGSAQPGNAKWHTVPGDEKWAHHNGARGGGDSGSRG